MRASLFQIIKINSILEETSLTEGVKHWNFAEASDGGK